MLAATDILVSLTLITEDEEYLVESKVAHKVREVLGGMKLDTYNHRYLIRLTVEEIKDVGGDDEGAD